MASQRDVMRALYQHCTDEEAVVRQYARAEREGRVERTSNTHRWDPETYARALLRDGLRKGRIKDRQWPRR